MNPMEVVASSAQMVVIGLVVMGTIAGIGRSRRRHELEHLERIKAMEVGFVPRAAGMDWPLAAVCIAIGAAVPVVSFAIRWLATLPAEAPDIIWIAPAFVSFAAIGGARISRTGSPTRVRARGSPPRPRR